MAKKDKKKKTGGRRKGASFNQPTKEARKAAHAASVKKWRREKALKQACAGQQPIRKAAKEVTQPKEGWPDEAEMQNYFPGFDNFLRDLRTWMLNEHTCSTMETGTIFYAVKDGIKAGIRRWGGGREELDCFN